MKKVLFVINNLKTGGVQSSLLNFVKEIQNRYEITILCFDIVGDGNMKGKLQDLCKECGISDVVSFYGNQLNPYRFIKNADLFLLPS